MTTKHTPGPWHADSVDRVRSTHGIVIARCGREDRHEYMPHAEQSANARYCAAAPVLADALRALVDYAAECAAERDERPQAIADARALLASLDS